MHAARLSMDQPGFQPNASADQPDPMFDPHAQEWEKNYAMLSHLSLIAAHVLPVVPTLVIWLIKRDQSPFVDDHGKEALNFQISLCLYIVASVILAFCGVGFVLVVGAYALGVVGMILATMAASKGRYYRYPMCVRLVR
ncbi:MAG: DUF4870 domain-containing protein [Phycisphaerales bacterium]|nr:DUF4870 domain-containing protein [Phycisphaerales bacterium]